MLYSALLKHVVLSVCRDQHSPTLQLLVRPELELVGAGHEEGRTDGPAGPAGPAGPVHPPLSDWDIFWV